MNKNVDFPTLAIVGDGITATAVREKIRQLGLSEVAPQAAQWVMVSPGIPPEKYPKTQGEYISEIELAYRLWQRMSPIQPKLIGITGTNGKSTVTAMLSHILGCPALGNFGLPYITTVPTNSQAPIPPYLAIELSSYQLETCSTFRPDVALILNLTPDHLERHPTMDQYMAAKARITRAQTPQDSLIIPPDPFIEAAIKGTKATLKSLSPLNPAWHLIKTPLVGTHNRLNALAAYLACERLGVEKKQVLDKILTFHTLEHRLEWVRTFQGCDIYNDSKGTNPDSTQIAMAAFDRPLHLVLGGKDKGLDLQDFLEEVYLRVKSVAVYGEIATRLLKEARQAHPDFPIRDHFFLEDALYYAVGHAQPGDIILFSPACSSFDQFQNFEHRGKIFKSLVMSLKEKDGPQ